MFKKIGVLLFFFFLFPFHNGMAEDPIAVKGEINFLKNPIEEGDSYGLKGEWFFYWNKWIPPEQFKERTPLADGFLKVPGLWNFFPDPIKKGSKVGPRGIATYALKVKNVKSLEPLSIYIRSFSSAYKLYLVDQTGVSELGKAGVIGRKKNKMVSWWQPKVLRLKTHPENFTLVIHLSNFHVRKGGLWNVPQFGSSSTINRNFQFRLLRDFFVIGIFLIMGLYHLSLFSLRRKDFGSFWFALFCLTMCVRSFCMDLYVFYFYEDPSQFIFSWSVTFEYATMFLAGLFFTRFISYLFPDYFGPKTDKVVLSITLSCSTIILISSPWIINLTLPVVQVFALVLILFVMIQLARATLKGVEFAKLFLISTFVWTGVIFHDVLITQSILTPPYVLPYGFVFLIFIQSYILANKMSYAFETAEKLGKDLEKEVDKKTLQIEAQYKDFKTLLFNLEQGFLVFDSEGLIRGESTKITKDIFEIDPKNKKIEEVFRLIGPEKDKFKGWLNHLFKGRVPFRDLLSLAPKEFSKIEGKIISLDYRPLFEDKNSKKLEKVVCIATDITEKKVFELKSKREKEKVDMINSLLEGPLEFLDLLTEAGDAIDDLSESIEASGTESIFRTFHTLKARFASFKISRVSSCIHALENDLDEFKKENLWGTHEIKKTAQHIGKIDFQLKDFMRENRKLIEIANSSLSSGEGAQELQQAKVELINFYNSISKNFILKNIRESFKQFVEPTKELAKTLDKLIDINIGESTILINPDKYKATFSSLLHAFRNAVDHGIEPREERKEKGKNTIANIEVSFKEIGVSRFKILIKDDGQGIDPQKIRQKLSEQKKLEMGSLSDEEIIQFIFDAGFSTKDQATEVSGRGVGMDAIKNEVEKIDGQIWVESTLDQGTCLYIELPILR